MAEFSRAILTIVGAGPAGLAAAVQAAECGLDVTVIEEQLRYGGQIFRQPPASFALPAGAATRESVKARALFDHVERHRARIRFRLDTLVWGASPGHSGATPSPSDSASAASNGATLSLVSGGKAETWPTAALILATGATERVYPFPGWTLPGVFTAGALQILLKSQFVLPGRRIVVAGTGPLLLVLAEQLRDAGAEVPAILELGNMASGWLRLHKWRGNLSLLGEGLGYHWRRLRAGVPFRQRHTILEARGETQVREIVMGPVDSNWRPTGGRRETIAVDAVAVSHGFVSNTELGLLLGCEHRYVEDFGGWVPVTDATQQTSVPGVFAGGDGAGVAGSAVAEVEGALAALGAALYLQAIPRAEHDRLAKPLLTRRRALLRFREFLDPLSRFRPGLLDACTPETTVCRCEGITRSEIDGALSQGYSHQLSLKLKTRAGMGLCQGRTCRPALTQLMARALGCAPADTGLHHPRAPLRPLPLQALVREPS